MPSKTTAGSPPRPSNCSGWSRRSTRRGFGVNLDTGNFHGADPYADLAKIAPYAVNVQVKTEIAPAGGKKGDADLSREIAILRDAKYSGYVVLEYEAAEDPMVAIPRHIKTLRSLMG